MEIILNYFPNLTKKQINQFKELESLYFFWNEKINLISRKDTAQLYTNHVLHSLGIAKIISFEDESKILDVGTGGGFPGIPLAILFPNSEFHLIDSIQKKIGAVNEIAKSLELKNVNATAIRAEKVKTKYDFVVSRAVAQMPKFADWIREKFTKENKNALANGVLYLKGGDLTEELSSFPEATIYNLSEFFSEEFFETKKVVYIPSLFV